MEAVTALDYKIVFNNVGVEYLNTFLEESKYSKMFILVDTNTQENCLASFLGTLSTSIDIEVIEIDPGEENKTIATCEGVWGALADLEADRQGVILNLGGGVVTDLGGFVASTFKRGMDFINVPTTLLSMVDASVGGKTGVDLGVLKNLVGVINNPQLVLVNTSFLQTLSAKEMRSGLAEVYKHGLIASKQYWESLKNLDQLTTNDLDKIIIESIEIKNEIVLKDPTEQNIRKTLNFGHTLGHAIESYCLDSPKRERLLHGEAIAIGMILESFISYKKDYLSDSSLNEISSVLINMYDRSNFQHEEIEAIIINLKYDKKNSSGSINFVLLEEIGAPIIDQKVPNELIYDAFSYYKDLYSA